MTETVCSSVGPIDIGSGVTIEKRYINGQLAGVAYTHDCPHGNKNDYIPIDGDHGTPDGMGWRLEVDDPLTVSPSLLCRACGHHGFIRNGKWVSA